MDNINKNLDRLLVDASKYLFDLNYIEAEKLLTQALNIDPYDSESLLMHAQIQSATGRYLDAISTYRNALTNIPRTPEYNSKIGSIYSCIGQCYLAINKPLEAEKLMGALFPIYRNVFDFSYVLGLSLYLSHSIEKASKIFEICLELQPNNKTVIQMLASIYLTFRNHSGIEFLIELSKQNGEINNLLLTRFEVQKLAARGSLSDAIFLGEKLKKFNTDSAEIDIQLLSLYCKVGEFEKATAILSSLDDDCSLKKSPEFLTIKCEYYKALYELDSCAQIHEFCIENDIDKADSLRNIFIIECMRGNPLSAKRNLDALFKLSKETLAPTAFKKLLNNVYVKIFSPTLEDIHLIRYEDKAKGLSLKEQITILFNYFDGGLVSTPVAIVMLTHARRLGVLKNSTPLNVSNNVTTSIPLKIFQFWDKLTPPDDVEKNMKTWRDFNPEFSYELYNDETAEIFLQENFSAPVLKAFRMAAHPAMRADIFRLAYLSKVGGVYVDADDICIKGIRDLFRFGYDLILFQEPIGSLANNFIASAHSHPMICQALNDAVSRVLEMPSKSIWHTTGPGSLSLTFCRKYFKHLQIGKLPAGVLIYEHHYMASFANMYLPQEYKKTTTNWWVAFERQGNNLYRAI